MATYVCSRHELKVRFLSPAPIFVILVMIFLCGSASAYDFVDGQLYSFSDVPFSVTTSGNGISNTVHSAGSYPLYSSGVSVNVMTVPSGSGSGSTGNSPDVSYFNYPSPNFRFLHIRALVPKKDTSSSVGLFVSLVRVRVFTARLNASSGTAAYWNSSVESDGTLSLTGGSGSAATCYSYQYEIFSDHIVEDYYFAVNHNYVFLGCGYQANLDDWAYVDPVVPNERFWFEYSSSKIIPPSSGSGGGSVDLSGITSQINSLSAQMTASFNQVNANIDAAESSISQSIENQTNALQGTIHQEVNGLHEHFDSWDRNVSDAFGSVDAQIVVDTNAAVSGVHQFEQDQVDDTEAALDDVGLDAYTIPSEISGTFSEVGTILSLLFNSFGFVTPLIIFSCTFGIAFVLVGRKSRGSE